MKTHELRGGDLVEKIFSRFNRGGTPLLYLCTIREGYRESRMRISTGNLNPKKPATTFWGMTPKSDRINYYYFLTPDGIQAFNFKEIRFWRLAQRLRDTHG